MQREEKLLESALDAISQRINDLKSSIHSLISKLQEDPNVNWPSVLDSFALISGQMNAILKVMKNDKTPLLRNQIVLPLLLSPDPDEELAKATQNRVSALTHDITPDLLRTKPDPDVEIRQNQFEQRATQVPQETAQKQINALNKVVSHVLDQISHSREEWENEANVREAAAVTCKTSDTHSLIASVGLGRNLKHGSVSAPSQTSTGRGGQAAGIGTSTSKAASTIKTNIKAATQVHPYNR